MSFSARQISNWLLSWSEDSEGEDAGLTNLKLQKLLYYAQGSYLGTQNKPLFDDSIEAWAHGPVVATEYHRLKSYNSSAINVEEAVDSDFDWDDYRDVEDHLIGVWNTYGKYAAWTLREKTHQEAPWKAAFAIGQNTEITQDSLRAYFSQLS